MLKSFRASAPQHVQDHRSRDVRATGNAHVVHDRPTSSTASQAPSSSGVPPSVLTSWFTAGLPPVIALGAVLLALVVWKIPLASRADLITAMIFLIVLGFDRALRGTDTG